MTEREIDRPLGKPARRLRPPSASGWLGAAGAAGIVLLGLVVALQPDNIRMPVQTVTTTPEVSAASEDVPPAPTQRAERLQPSATSGPSIIRVNPETDAPAPNVIVIRDPSSVGQELQVAHLPDRALLEQSELGPLPVRAADGRRPFDVYARPSSGRRGARVALVIGGLALSQTGTQEAIEKLPPEVTLAFAPQGNSIGRWMQMARRQGHEIMMQVPLEPFDYPRINPGRNTLTIAASADDNLRDLRWALSRTTNYTGVMSYMGARFVADEAALSPVMEELGERGLLFLDDGSSARSLAPDLAARNRVPLATADAVIDDQQERGLILRKLDAVEATARSRGHAIATGSAFPVTVDAVVSWIGEARRRGIEIVPVTALAADPERN